MVADVVILGAGPAGASVALNLAALHRVTVIDQLADARPRIGESLPGAARRLLVDMGLWSDFLVAGHLPRHVLRSVWGDPTPTERHALTDPDGHGWQLDRAGFELQLRRKAVTRGANLVAPARIHSVERCGIGWRVLVVENGIERTIDARILIDATGRASRRLTALGARRIVTDRLHCAWLRAPAALLPPGMVQVEADTDGWWYAANAPGAAILAFHTDTDLLAAGHGRSRDRLLAAARRLPMLAEQLLGTAWSTAEHGVCAAHGTSLDPAAGEGWLATGDAALAFDPLCAQGLFNALYLGLAAAETADRMLCGDTPASADYGDEVRRIHAAYTANIAAWYSTENRWTDRPFWHRRHEQSANVSVARDHAGLGWR